MAYLVVVGAIVLILDQVTKLWIQQLFPLNAGQIIIPGFFNLVHVRNPGGAFSLFATASLEWRRLVFIGLTVIVIGVLLYAYAKLKKEETWARTSYVLITSGAVGNLIDRVRFGEVVDFLEFYMGPYHWPAFNIADSAISVGAVMLLWSVLRAK